MTQSITKNIVAIAFVAGLFSIFLAMPSTSEAKVSVSDLRMNANKMMASSTANKVSKTTDLSCVQGAVLDRETAIIESWSDFNTSVSAALTVRKDALVEAWKVTDSKERATDLKDLWKNWKDASRKAHAGLKADRKSAWTEFKETMKTECKEARLPKEDMEPKDASGTVTI